MAPSRRPGRLALIADALAAIGAGAAVVVFLGAGLQFRAAGLSIRANDPWRWLFAAAVLMAMRVALTRASTQVPIREAVRETVVRTAQFAVFTTMASVVLTALVTSCGGLDSAGYFGAADLLSRARLIESAPVARILGIPAAAAPLGWTPAAQPFSIAPQFPLGFPLVLALARVLCGQAAPFFVVPVLGAAAVALSYRIARAEADVPTAALGAALVATSPILVNMSIQPMSDVPATFWLLLSAAAAWRRVPRPLLWGVAAGMGVLTRPPLLLGVLVVAATGRWTWRDLLKGAAVLAVFVAAMLAAQWYMFGDPFMSGHGDRRQLFALAPFAHNAAAQMKWLMYSHTPLVILAFAAALRRMPGLGVRALLTFVAVALPYLFYTVRFDDWEMTRFLLPGWVLVLVVGAESVTWLASVCRAGPATVASAVSVLAAAASLWFLSAHHVFAVKEQERKYPMVAAWVEANTPREAALISSLHSGSLKYYTGRETVRLDALPADGLAAAVGALERADRVPFVVVESGPDSELFFQRYQSESSSGLALTPLATVRGTVIMRVSSRR